MIANKVKINLSTVPTGTTDSYINIPINLEYQIVDQGELVERVFVDVQTEAAINPIIDYEKVRFLPLDLNGNHIDKVIYNVDLMGATDYGSIGFSDDDIKFEKQVFKQTFLDLNFFDSDNPLTQNLVTYITLYSELRPSDLLPYGTTIGMPGQPKPANQIGLNFVLENPILNPKGFAEGYFLYDYKDELTIGESKYLYMRASFKNAKTGKSTNLMVKNTAMEIDSLVHELYTRYKLVRSTTGYYYEIDDTYQGNTLSGPNNINYSLNPSFNSVSINLYQIQAL